MSIRTRGSNSSIKTVVVGLGRIGLGSSKSSALAANPRKEDSHVMTLLKQKNFRLIAGVDLSNEKRSEFERVAQCKAFETINDFIVKENKVDLVVVATPTMSHKEIVQEALLKLVPKVLVCEKPMGLDENETMEIVSICKEKEVIWYPGYFRVYDPLIMELRRRIAHGEFGKFVEGKVFYGQDLRNNGCHFLHLTLSLVTSVTKGLELERVHVYDPSNPIFFLRMGNGAHLSVIGVGSDLRRTGEILLCFEKGMISYENGGARVRVATKEPSKTWWTRSDESYVGKSSTGIVNLYKTIQNHFRGKELRFLCEQGGHTEIATQAIISAALNQNLGTISIS